MSARRVWLIEGLDAAGAAVEDARIHARALTDAGCEVRAFVAGSGGLEELAGASRGSNDRGAPDLTIIASATAGGGPAARHAPRGVPWIWWPTGLANGTRWRIGRRVPSLPFAGAGPSEPGAPGLAASTSEATSRRRTVPLWDGELVLVPGPLEKRNGEACIGAFAEAADAWSGLDLVVLAEPQPAFAALARSAGVGARLHFAGPATREAEHAWLCTATALLLDADAPVSGGLVLRSLGRGVPVVPVGRGETGEVLRDWLARRGCLSCAGSDGEVLGRALNRDEEGTRSIARGREVAAEHDLAALARRLAGALDVTESRRAA